MNRPAIRSFHGHDLDSAQRQSGTPGFAIASLEAHGDLLEIARKDAHYLLDRDPELTGERGTAVRTLLYLFRRDEAIRFLSAG